MIAVSHSNNEMLINTLLNLKQPCEKLKAGEVYSAISWKRRGKPDRILRAKDQNIKAFFLK